MKIEISIRSLNYSYSVSRASVERAGWNRIDKRKATLLRRVRDIEKNITVICHMIAVGWDFK